MITVRLETVTRRGRVDVVMLWTVYDYLFIGFRGRRKTDGCMWVSRVNRADLLLKDITNNTVLCSLHFHQGKKTLDQPHPVRFAHRSYPLCRHKSFRLPATALAPPPTPSQQCSTPTGSHKKTSSPPLLSELAYYAARGRLASQEREITTLTAQVASLRADRNNEPQQVFLSTENLSKKPDKFRYYTGLPSTGTFDAIVKHLDDAIPSLLLNRPAGKKDDKANPRPSPAGHLGSQSASKRGRPRALSPRNEFLLLIVWLRHALKHEVLADMFALSSGLASQLHFEHLATVHGKESQWSHEMAVAGGS